ncbi:MAG: hypothetical protein HKN33_04735 [Pyrinomonadaceae bacterium]|nr:hypothetical protein [Pyrinomonadaceae bacterium]
MKNLISALVVCLVLMGVNSYAQKSTKKIKFTSVYTDLSKDCEVDEGEAGSDSTSDCGGPGGYGIYDNPSASSTAYYIDVPGETAGILIARQNYDYDHTKMKAEWRLANGKPFALIMRFFSYGEPKDEDGRFGKKNGEYLRVVGLKGFDHIDSSVDAKTPNANVKAREIADSGYSKKQ